MKGRVAVRRRGNGEGTITQRKDGRWQAVFTMGNGRRRWLYADTRREVAEKLTTALRGRAQGATVPDGRQTVGAFLTSWLQTTKATVRYSTWRGYDGNVRKHLVPAIGKVSLARLSPQHLQKLYADMLASGSSPATVGHVHMIIGLALGQAQRWDAVTRNVQRLVDPPKFRRTDMQTLNEEQVRQFLDVAAGTRLEALFRLALTTGMRQGELLGLRWRDVDLERRELRCRAALVRAAGGYVVADTKTSGSRRRIALGETTVAALRRHKVTQATERLKVGSAWQDNDLVFTNAVGDHLDPLNLTRRTFRNLLKQADLPPIRFHDLRHTAATLALSRNVHVKIVSEMLGHASIAITLDTYSHVVPTMQAAAAATLDDIVSERGTQEPTLDHSLTTAPANGDERRRTLPA